MTRNTKFVIWVFAVALFAFVAGRFVPPHEVNLPVQTTSHGSPQGRHVSSRGAPVAQPAQTAPSSPAVQSTATGRAAPQPQQLISVSDLGDLMDAKPSTIVSLTFTNGSNDVLVGRVDGSNFTVTVPDDGKGDLREQAATDHIRVVVKEVKVDPIAHFISNNLLTLIVLGGMVAFFFLAQNAQKKQAKGVMGFGSSRAKDADKLKENIEKASFSDVAGCDEAVKELRRIVKGIVGTDVYELFHAELPKGVLLIGPPGTGKTHLARAVAGETGGSFDITSGSDFVEMLVGVGASRVRDMFDKARKKVAETKKPHIIFIDEIDAIGGKRGGAGVPGNNSEREQTLNQILVEMDGMVGNEGIFIIAATNRVDMLDEALLRQGRFDCHVSVDLPDKAGREQIFQIHLRDILGDGVFLGADVTLAGLAHRTYSYSGAEIKGVCNRAKILAAERYAPMIEGWKAKGKTIAEIKKLVRLEVAISDFDEAIDFVRYGNAAESKQARMNEVDKKNTAVHEAGHALAAAAMPGCDPVVKITIMRRSRALGYVQYLPENDRVSFTRDQALSRIVSMMAGRAAQEIILGTCDTGASNDFQQATDMARQMVVSWGMSKLGYISVGSRQDMMGTSGAPNRVGPDLANEIDREWRAITSACSKAERQIVDDRR